MVKAHSTSKACTYSYFKTQVKANIYGNFQAS